MKVTLTLNLGAYSGKLGEVVYISHYNYRLCHGRIFSPPKQTEQNLKIKEINANLNALYLQTTEGYREDLRRYALQNRIENQERTIALRKQMPGAKALFVKCVWAWARQFPELVDLQTVSLAELVSLEAPLCRVKDCIEAGYLRKVQNWERLDEFIS